KHVCVDNDVATCGTNGNCDGAGGCQRYANGTHCSDAICTGGATSLTTAGTCSSNSCQTGTQSCNGFLCKGGSTCPTCRANHMDCNRARHYCTAPGGTCQLKLGPGDMCSSDHQCPASASHCTDGVCCASASCGTCQACNLGGMNPGTCQPLGAGTPD